ncbi:uncharacterized protein LOC126810250 isoform X2 [Patella vulgata]|nr:uncharacterized protein LOC126810250 isoform X2 [Patella vulgata]XP_050391221.1 uncharacterized protein LOC126810250 isoform X2 [Patella vulgata]
MVRQYHALTTVICICITLTGGLVHYQCYSTKCPKAEIKCGPDYHIALTEIRYGFKNKSCNSPTQCDATCCNYESGDCLTSYEDDKLNLAYDHCQLYDKCQIDIERITAEECGRGWSSFTKIEYECIADSDIQMDLVEGNKSSILYNMAHSNLADVVCRVTSNSDVKIKIQQLSLQAPSNSERKLTIVNSTETVVAYDETYKFYKELGKHGTPITVTIRDLDKSDIIWISFEGVDVYINCEKLPSRVGDQNGANTEKSSPDKQSPNEQPPDEQPPVWIYIIVGIVGLLLVVIIIVVIYFLHKRSKKKTSIAARLDTTSNNYTYSEIPLTGTPELNTADSSVHYRVPDQTVEYKYTEPAPITHSELNVAASDTHPELSDDYDHLGELRKGGQPINTTHYHHLPMNKGYPASNDDYNHLGALKVDNSTVDDTYNHLGGVSKDKLDDDDLYNHLKK